MILLMILLAPVGICFGQKDSTEKEHFGGDYFTKGSTKIEGHWDSIPEYDKQDAHLHINAILVDSIKFSYHCHDLQYSFIYKFKIKGISLGRYTNEFIYICNYDSLSSNNFIKRKEIYWVVIKTTELYNNIPIYVHSGNF